MNQVLIQKINKTLKKAKKRGLNFKELASLCGINIKKQQREFREAIRFLEAKGLVIDRNTRIYHTDFLELWAGTVTRLMKTYGFVRRKEDGVEIFIPGKYFMGAMPGDSVLVTPIPSKGASPEGEIVKIIHEGNAEFTGTLKQTENGWAVEPDELIRFDMPVSNRDAKNAKDGDKVCCRIIARGSRHSEHRAMIVNSYGDAQTAANCAQALLDVNRISTTFPAQVKAEAVFINNRGIKENDLFDREDYRDEIIFTIDGADTKDIDDAISLRKMGDSYELGVHIADVSHYVKQNSKLDEEAFNRGTSIYFADRVVPMLPPELSNGICSLNPKEDRLAFSCIMTVSATGHLVDYAFKKSVIRSRVKGVYKEINQILDHSESEEIRQKYNGLYDTIFLMHELAKILTQNKRDRGAPEIETSESYIVLDENGITVDILPRTRGESEVMIEEFMLIANEAAASAAKLKEVPFVYRIHEPPSEDKMTGLHTALTALGIDAKTIKTGAPPLELSKLITNAKGTRLYPLINTLVLRSMSKAKYHEVPIGHYGLGLENYAQFTSPIRRYPDLTIHRILSEIAKGTPSKKITAKFEKFVVKSARRSTETELNAMKLERQCDDIYKAEYMKAHIGEEFDGIISSLAPQGIYVSLPNTAEGLIKVEHLPKGEYDFNDMLEYKNRLSGKSYRIGDNVRVRCISVDVSAGNVDFEAISE